MLFVVLISCIIGAQFVINNLFEEIDKQQSIIELQQETIVIADYRIKLYEEEIVDYKETVNKQDNKIIQLMAYFSYEATPLVCTIDEAVFWLERAANSHDPKVNDGDISDDAFHQGCMDRYKSIILLIQRLEKEVMLTKNSNSSK